MGHTHPARRVVLVCGPPGAGKTTLAHTLNLSVYDADDPQWPSERAFRAALRILATNPAAQAVVIRAGATRAARANAARLCGASETVILPTDPETCVARVIARGRPTARREVAGVHGWWDAWEPPDPPGLGTTSREW